MEAKGGLNQRSRESLDFLNRAVSVTIPDGSKGWNWFMSHLRGLFMFRGGFTFRPLESPCVLLNTRDEVARQQLLTTRVVFVKGIKMYLSKSFKFEWGSRKELWVSLLGLPHHLWSFENSRILAGGEERVEVERRCLEFAEMEVFRAKIRTAGSMRIWDF